MSEQAVESPAEAATEAITASTVVEKGGPTSFAEALEREFGKEDAPEESEEAPSMTKEEMDDFLRPQDEDKPAEEAPETKAEETPADPVAEEDLGEFGFEKDGDEEEPTEEEFDAEAFDKETEKQVEDLADPKKGDAWRKLRNENRDLKTGAKPSAREAEIQSKLAEAEKKAAQVDEIQERLNELTTQNYILEVQDSPEYKRQVAAPAAEINAVMDQVAGAYDFVSREDLEKAIREPDLPTRAALIDKIGVVEDEDGEPSQRLPSLVQNEIQRVAMLFGKIQHENETLMADAKGKFETIQAERETASLKAAEEDRALVKRHLEDRWDKFRKAVPSDAIDKAQKRSASLDIREATPANRAYAQMAGEAFPLALAEIKELRAQVSKLGGKAKAAKAATPNLSQGSGKTEEGKPKGPKSFAEASRLMGDL